jgi:membrane-associated protease RseP (regulator of RpoE activity)
MARALARLRPLGRLPVLNAALFVATVATTLLAGAGQSSLPRGADLSSVAVAGLPFATALIGILFSHEMGHYLVARAYGVDTTLPFFIPVPLGIGTFGAVIRIRSPIPSRRAALDIGAAGPIAGFCVALPLFAWGIAHSEVRPVADALVQGADGAGSPYALLRSLARGEPLGAGLGGVQLMGDSLATLGAQWLVLGPMPAGHDVFLHPVAYAAWIGLFVTTLNLLPIGQLDGGHVTYALLGPRLAYATSKLVSYALLGCGLFLSWNWLVWWAITRFAVRLGHPPSVVEEPLDPSRQAVAVFSLALFAVTFIPVPISM